jgi:hypothetical protein
MAGLARGPPQAVPVVVRARSTFQDTLLRVSDATLFERPVVITNSAYRFMVREQLAEIGLEADVLLEPMRRDSGPRSRPAQPLRRRAIGKRSCWRSPPITWFATRPPSSQRAVRG